MTLKEKDFIEIEFIGKIKDTQEVFDSNIKEELEKLKSQSEAKPFIFSLGQDMFLKGVDEFLIGKSEESSEYTIELNPEKAFGNRDPQLIKMVPRQVFLQQKINPYPGAVFNFDNQIGKVLTVSGGRIRVDFNNPLAGKPVVYKIKVLRKITNINEKVKALMDFLFRREFDFEIKEQKLIISLKQEEKPYKQFVEMFKNKFKDILELDLEIKEIVEKNTLSFKEEKSEK